MATLIGSLKKLWFTTAKLTDETHSSSERIRQVGLVYSVYRIMVGTFLWLINQNPKIRGMLDKHEHLLFSPFVEKVALGFYLSFGLIMLIIVYFVKKHTKNTLTVGFVIDMLVLSMFLYGGAVNDLQTVLLFMVVVAASFMLTDLSSAISITLLAILSLVFQQVFYVAANQTSFLTLTDAIMLSISLIAVGFLSWSISQRLAIAESRASRNAEEIKRLHAINQEVIYNMVNGVIVIAKSGRILTINHAAKQLLRLSDQPASNFESLFEIECHLAQSFPVMYEWYSQNSHQESLELVLPASESFFTDKLRLHKKRLPKYGLLIIIEDVSREESHAQQLKLASLGQLTASIAHEVRNPLGAISQASQMLIEDLDDDNQELCQIIYQQTLRVNRIIEDVMRLSRQETPNQTIIELKKWLPAFLTDYFDNQAIATQFSGQTLIYFDCNHLEQIFINLINNGLRHTKKLNNLPDMCIDVRQSGHEVIIDILDNGDGVAKQHLPHLFNPFFTTSQNGTGLGLYLSQAFSEANHARLRYIPNQAKSCFRLICTTPTILN